MQDMMNGQTSIIIIVLFKMLWHVVPRDWNLCGVTEVIYIRMNTHRTTRMVVQGVLETCQKEGDNYCRLKGATLEVKK